MLLQPIREVRRLWLGEWQYFPLRHGFVAADLLGLVNGSRTRFLHCALLLITLFILTFFFLFLLLQLYLVTLPFPLCALLGPRLAMKCERHDFCNQ